MSKRGIYFCFSLSYQLLYALIPFLVFEHYETEALYLELFLTCFLSKVAPY